MITLLAFDAMKQTQGGHCKPVFLANSVDMSCVAVCCTPCERGGVRTVPLCSCVAHLSWRCLLYLFIVLELSLQGAQGEGGGVWGACQSELERLAMTKH